MKRHSILLLAMFTGLAAVAYAQQSPDKVGVVTSTELGKVSKQVSTLLTATVEAVDGASRTVTLKTSEGNVLAVVAGDEVRNFDQIEVGDRIDVRYSAGLVLQLVKGGGGTRSRVESENATTAPRGEKPQGVAVREVLVVADVVKIDEEKQTVTLRGPQRTVELQVLDPEQLKNIAVGDQVEATFTEAAAISLQPAAEKQ